MTMTDQEKRQAAGIDDRAAKLLERTESLVREQLMGLHGTMRPSHASESQTHNKPTTVCIDGITLQAGDHVRLDPKGNADAFDVVLRGLRATIVSIEQDFEGRLHLAVTIDDDPGADFGGRGQPGHRFFFSPDDVQPLPAQEAPHE